MDHQREQEAIKSYKMRNLDNVAAYRQNLYQNPQLRQLFLELTLRCNERCFHCGSRCSADNQDGLSLETYKQIIDEIAENFPKEQIQFCITGGEPLLRPDFFEIVSYIHENGFKWGMTTNGTLITKEVAGKLREAGMGTVSISIDGLEETHDRQRGLKGGFRKAMDGIQNLIDEQCFRAIQVTTVLNHNSMVELDDLYALFLPMDIDSWRVIGIEPIGRALDHPELLLTTEDQRRLFAFIKEKRQADIPVCYGCSHFLGLDYERDVRDWYFLCTAGIQVASIDASGDIRACLDIEKTPETVQGNIFRDSFTDVWRHQFKMFRQPLSLRNADCHRCEYEKWCAGGAHHSFDYEKNCPMICMKNILF